MAHVTQPPTGSHPEVGATHRRNGLGRSTHRDLHRTLPAKEIQQQFTRLTAEQSRRRTGPYGHPLAGTNPRDAKPPTVQSPTQIATAAPNIPP